MIKLSITELREASLTRPPAYLSDVLSQGKAEGGILYIEKSAFDRLRVKYRGSTLPRPTMTNLVKSRYEICKTCSEATDQAFSCSLYQGCCFALYRTQSTSQCPSSPPKWPAITASESPPHGP